MPDSDHTTCWVRHATQPPVAHLCRVSLAEPLVQNCTAILCQTAAAPLAGSGMSPRKHTLLTILRHSQPTTSDKRLPATTHLKMCLTLGQLLSLSTCTRVVNLTKASQDALPLGSCMTRARDFPGPSNVLLGRGSLHGRPAGDCCSTTSHPSPPRTPTCAPTVPHSRLALRATTGLNT